MPSPSFRLAGMPLRPRVPAPRESLQQHGFHLVVQMVRKQQAFSRRQGFGKCFIAGNPGAIFRAGAGFRHGHRAHTERNIPPPAKITAKFFPFTRVRLQSMIHMQRSQRPISRQTLFDGMQQNHGIHPTA